MKDVEIDFFVRTLSSGNSYRFYSAKRNQHFSNRNSIDVPRIGYLQ